MILVVPVLEMNKKELEERIIALQNFYMVK